MDHLRWCLGAKHGVMLVEPSENLSRSHYEKGRQGEVKHSVTDISKAVKDFGIAPEYDLSRGLAEMVTE